METKLPNAYALSLAGSPALRDLLALIPNSPAVPAVLEAAMMAEKKEADDARALEYARAQFTGAAALGAALDALETDGDEADAETVAAAVKALTDAGHEPDAYGEVGNEEDPFTSEPLVEALREAIQADPLEIDLDTEGEARIVLCTGGPHAEFTVELNRWNEADRVSEVVYKDWGTRIENPMGVDHEGLLAYARALGEFSR